MADLYRLFAEPWYSVLDFSDEALVSLYNRESYGSPLTPNNGFAVGKQYLNLQVNGWKEMIREGTLCKRELYDDPKYADHHEWLDSVLKNTYVGCTYDELLKISRIG